MPPEGVRRADAGHSGMNNTSASPSRAWLHARARLMPDLLPQSPPWVRSVFAHSWAPMRALSRQLEHLPSHLWSQLQRWESGYVVLCTTDSRYVPGPARIRRQRLTNVAFVSIEDLAAANERTIHTLGHLIDHHLGCGGEAEGPWLSDGGGISAHWQQAGQRLSDLYALGYAVDPVAQASVRDYFAQSLAIYCLDRQRLNVADPAIYKWLRSTLWNEAFWAEHD
jgi:hypothetical protein